MLVAFLSQAVKILDVTSGLSFEKVDHFGSLFKNIFAQFASKVGSSRSYSGTAAARLLHAWRSTSAAPSQTSRGEISLRE